jgi:hypothetical protein
VAIELMRPRPQDLNAVCKLRQTRIDQAGLPDPRLTLDQHDLTATGASARDGVPQDPQLVLPTKNQPPHWTGSYSRNSRHELPPPYEVHTRGRGPPARTEMA